MSHYPELEEFTRYKPQSALVRNLKVLGGIAVLAGAAYGAREGWRQWKLHTSTFSELAREGAECAGRGDAECAVTFWKAATEKEPGDASAMANLAMNLTSADRHAEALPVYEKALSLGSGAYDFLANYGRSLRSRGRADEALTMFYRTLESNPRLSDITRETSELLVQKNQVAEAIGLLGAFDVRYGKEYFGAQIRTLSARLEGQDASSKKQSMSVPRLDGHYYLPVRIGARRRYDAFLVDTGATHTLIPEELLADAGKDVVDTGRKVRATVADGRTIELRRVLIGSLSVGQTVLRNVTADVCDSKGCGALLGQSVLEAFDLSTAREGGVEMLTLTHR